MSVKTAGMLTLLHIVFFPTFSLSFRRHIQSYFGMHAEFDKYQITETNAREMVIKIEIILKCSLDSIPSPSPSVNIQIMGGKVCLRFECCALSTNF